ncbi:hypothetical protein [Amycolatopsis sp. CB00013]|uniref:hypothetical protein n=1 Tax=Amycolatopsis sp. CB00013 TaxID=1703945 RepID=UPI0018E98BD9|nr:hypothetical protein [Amycolatopsis sp. CB00013]
MPRTDLETVDVLAPLPLEGIPGRGQRRAVWSCPGRLYIETYGLKGPEGARVARRVERALAEIPGVRWAQVNAPRRNRLPKPSGSKRTNAASCATCCIAGFPA